MADVLLTDYEAFTAWAEAYDWALCPETNDLNKRRAIARAQVLKIVSLLRQMEAVEQDVALKYYSSQSRLTAKARQSILHTAIARLEHAVMSTKAPGKNAPEHSAKQKGPTYGLTPMGHDSR